MLEAKNKRKGCFLLRKQDPGFFVLFFRKLKLFFVLFFEINSCKGKIFTLFWKKSKSKLYLLDIDNWLSEKHAQSLFFLLFWVLTHVRLGTVPSFRKVSKCCMLFFFSLLFLFVVFFTFEAVYQTWYYENWGDLHLKTEFGVSNYTFSFPISHVDFFISEKLFQTWRFWTITNIILIIQMFFQIVGVGSEDFFSSGPAPFIFLNAGVRYYNSNRAWKRCSFTQSHSRRNEYTLLPCNYIFCLRGLLDTLWTSGHNLPPSKQNPTPFLQEETLLQ